MWKKFEHNRDAYTDAKTDFIRHFTAEARKKYGNRYRILNNDSLFINIGFNNIVNISRVLAVISPDTLPSKRLIQECRETKKVIDATCGRKTRAVIVLDSGHIVLCWLSADTIYARLNVKPQNDNNT